MSDPHLAHLNLGSNIEPEIHLVRAVQLLSEAGEILKVSQAWESRSVGAAGPNYLNACISFAAHEMASEIKEQIIRPIEASLGRVRGGDKFAPRTIDIDIVLFDDQLLNAKSWDDAFVVIPLAEIHPLFEHPETREHIELRAARLRRDTWIRARPEVLQDWTRPIDQRGIRAG